MPTASFVHACTWCLFTVEHALSCPWGGFLFVHHNEICDSIAHLLKEICHDVSVEPAWSSAIDWGSLSYHSVVVDDGAHLGTGFWMFHINVLSLMYVCSIPIPHLISTSVDLLSPQ